MICPFTEKCSAKNGFYVNGMCYVYVENEQTYEDATDPAATNCPRNGEIWCPNLKDLDLYTKIAKSDHGEFFSKIHHYKFLFFQTFTIFQGLTITKL